VSLRIFIVNDADHVMRLPVAQFERIVGDAAEPVPGFIGQPRCRYVLLRLSQPTGDITFTECGVLHLNAEGRHDAAKRREEIASSMTAFDASGDPFRQKRPSLPEPVIDARPTFDQRITASHAATYKWKPSDAVWAQIAEALR
jgi:hypothetical protein